MGLFDDPMMNFGMGMMSAGGPSRMPVSFGQAMAQGMQQAQQAEAAQRQQALEALKIKMLQEDFALKKQQQERENAKLTKEAEAEKAMQAMMQQYFAKQQQPQQQWLGPEPAGAFQGAPEGIMAEINTIQDPMERTAATRALQNQLGGRLPGQQAQSSPQLNPMMFSRDPRMQTIGTSLFGAEKDAASRQEQNAFRSQERLDTDTRRREDREASDARNADLRRELAGNSRQPYFSPFDSSQGAMVFDHRTGKMVPATVDGKPLRKAASDPTLQGEIAGAKEAGQARAKRALNMAGFGDTIDEAKKLLSGTSGKPLPTGSSIGTAVDWAGGLIGSNPEGSEEAQTLKAIGGALTSKMPRMEGPQSDKDTKLYQEMAAVVGDSTIPRERRLAALGVVEELWGKYEEQQLGRESKGKIGTSTADSKQVVRRGKYQGRTVIQYSDGSVGYAD